ncbi:hypothetical protein BX666DRAFT_1867052 [Dichotomocladium elegans]|nr:hypothetical protein BX666DRAFT_1867052 [Dichotomocladium elegans]
MLADSYVQKCSELSIITKYWSVLFEAFWGYDRHVSIQWGDTLPAACIDVGLTFRVDIRVLLQTEFGDLEAATGEVISQKHLSASKLYREKLKSVLSSKSHLNTLLARLRTIKAHEVKSIYIPIVQVMGLECTVYALSLVDKNLYLLQTVNVFLFPRTLTDLRSEGIEKILNGFAQVEHMLTRLEDTLPTYSGDTTSAMAAITGGTKKAKQFNYAQWISPVITNTSSEDVEDSDDDDDDVSDSGI